MTDERPAPTALECDQATIAHHEIAECLNRLAREGFPATILTAGLAAATADLITCTVGIDQVPRWFAEQAMASDRLLRASG